MTDFDCNASLTAPSHGESALVRTCVRHGLTVRRYGLYAPRARGDSEVRDDDRPVGARSVR